ncbi:Acg family FMN-binding oxidoreductase [Pseudonocardia parietis]|uniref:Nitroreductase n=1 Tax=Pseudonocardia parietis TaxID=570936 RepID=A0ABS4VW57_9PSEU|nr:NAD(P)H nitroreductase [Pseudonocardia parietis]MBP2368161.1 nitroreductase [Pseudonocardia parietis]
MSTNPGRALPRPETVHSAVGAALRAPSVHNVQPWRWRISADRIELYADPERRLPFTDPNRRDHLISCGAALLHLHVALAAAGAGHKIVRFPDGDRDHLATVRFTGSPPDQQSRAEAPLARAIAHRHTDRRPFTAGLVARHTRAALGFHAARYGVTMHTVSGDLARGHLARGHLADLELEAAREMRTRPGQAAELLVWTHRYAGSGDGVHAESVPVSARRPCEPDLGVRFPPGSLPVPRTGQDRATIVVLTTPADDDPARLAAGEAAGAVLLAATRSGFATCPLSRLLEATQTRSDVARQVLRTPDRPQLLIRIGRAPDDRELPTTPRRRLSDVLVHGT